MTDPFSVVALSLTGLKIAKGLHGLILSLSNAPSELLALSNEVCNLKFVMDSVHEAMLEQSDQDLKRFDKLGPLLFQARVKFDQLDTMLERWTKANDNGRTGMKKIDRVFWLKEKDHIWELQKQFREIRANICVMLEATSLSISTRLSVDIQNLYAETTKTYRAHSDSLSSISEKVSGLDELRRGSEESVQLLQDIYGSMNRLIEQQTQLVKKSSSDVSLADSATKSKVKFVDVEYDEKHEETSVNQQAKNLAAVPDGLSSLVLSISRHSKKRPTCWDDCQCCCHSRHTVQSSPMLGRIVGRLFLGYSGPSITRQQCDLNTCQQKQDQDTQLRYFFPRWFVNKVLTVSFASTTGTPSLNIKVRKSVTETNPLFALSRFEGVEGIRRLFETREASPDDIDHRGGWSSLHFAVDHGCIEVCKLLLNAGADPNWEDNTGTTPVEVAWRNIMHLKAPPQLAEAFAVLFPGTEWLQERRFTRLHKLVIGLEEGNLEAETITNSQMVNVCDLDGWTPLHWASRRGNSEAVGTLLAHGADPFMLTENENRGPLHLAAQSNSALVIQQLLNYRKINKVLDINEKDGYGCTPLRVAAQYNNAAVTSYLIKAGADLNEPEHYGEGPLMTCISENRHETATLLLRAGADYTQKTKFDNTILHFAANVGDNTMLSILAKGRLRGLDPEALNSEGHTALDKLASREDPPEGFTKAFNRLLQSITDENFETSSWATSSMGESWHSFEEMSWYEAEAVIQEDVENAAEEAATIRHRKDSHIDEDKPTVLEKLEGISVRDMVMSATDGD